MTSRTTGTSSAGAVAAHAVGAALLVNAIPHGVHALAGEPFPSPFADPPGEGLSTPGENLVWSGVNAVAGAALLLVPGRFRFGANVDTVVTVAAGVLAAYGISRHFTGVRERREAGAVSPGTAG
jgi:hypothetical protein